MSGCRPKRWTYRGQHCFRACNLSRKGEMCQCKFDRKFEAKQRKEKREALEKENKNVAI